MVNFKYQISPVQCSIVVLLFHTSYLNMSGEILLKVPRIRDSISLSKSDGKVIDLKMGRVKISKTIQFDINSEALSKCFGFNITTTFSEDSFAKNLLDGIYFEKEVYDIKSLSKILVVNTDFYKFDVDVVCESGNLKVIERVSR